MKATTSKKARQSSSNIKVTKKSSQVRVGSGANPSRIQRFIQSTNGKLLFVALFVAIGVSSLVYVRAAKTTSSLWSDNSIPQTITTGDTNPVTLGTIFQSKYAGQVIGVRFYKGAQNTGTHIGGLWTVKGTMLASVTFANETSSGWQQAYFSKPIDIAANTPFIISYYAPHGHYSQTKHYFTKDYTNGPLTAPASGNGVEVFATGSNFPDKSSHSSDNFWVDVLVSTSTFIPSPAPLAPRNLTGSQSNSTVSLQWQASPSSDIASYTILRNGAPIGSVAAANLRFTDTPAAGKAYTYQVEAVDQGNLTSNPSNSVSITIPASPAPTPTPTPVPTPSPSSSLDSFFAPGFAGASFCHFTKQNFNVVNSVLTTYYPAGSSAPSAGAPFGGAQDCVPSATGPQSTLALTYSVRFPVGFQFVKGGKLPGLYGGVEPFSGGSHNANGWSARLMWRTGGAGEIYSYTAKTTGYGDEYGTGNFFWQADGQWHTVTERVTLNAPGTPNGTMTLVYDGKQVISQTGIDITDTGAPVTGLFFSTFYGGHDSTWAPTTNESVDFQGFSVSK